MKHLAPDLGDNIRAAKAAGEKCANVAQQLMPLLHEIETHLIICSQSGMKAEKLDYVLRRLEEIRFELNCLEIGSLCGITIKNVCEELWHKLP